MNMIGNKTCGTKVSTSQRRQIGLSQQFVSPFPTYPMLSLVFIQSKPGASFTWGFWAAHVGLKGSAYTKLRGSIFFRQSHAQGCKWNSDSGNSTGFECKERWAGSESGSSRHVVTSQKERDLLKWLVALRIVDSREARGEGVRIRIRVILT